MTTISPEQAHKLIALQAQHSFCIAADKDRIVRFFGHKAHRLFGYSEAEVVGQDLNLLLPEDRRAVHVDHFADYVNSTQSQRRMGEHMLDLQGRKKDGSLFDISITLLRLDDLVLAVGFEVDANGRRVRSFDSDIRRDLMRNTFEIEQLKQGHTKATLQRLPSAARRNVGEHGTKPLHFGVFDGQTYFPIEDRFSITRLTFCSDLVIEKGHITLSCRIDDGPWLEIVTLNKGDTYKVVDLKGTSDQSPLYLEPPGVFRFRVGMDGFSPSRAELAVYPAGYLVS